MRSPAGRSRGTRQLEARIATLTPDEVRDALRRHLKLDELSIVKAGDFNKVTAKAAEAKPN